jgi:predicted methyltransferase
LHRIDERSFREEILKAGFVFEAEADFLRNPNDLRDWNAAPGASGDRRGTSDRFVLRFRKPSSETPDPKLTAPPAG